MDRLRWTSAIAAAMLLGLQLVSCSNGEEVVGPGPGATPETLGAAPETVSVAGVALRLRTYIWRDFMPGPGAERDGSPMMAAFQVMTVDGTPVPPTLRANVGWIVWGDRVWEGPVAEERPREAGGSKLEVMMRGGPKWGPGIYVDAVVRIVDGEGIAHLLAARHQEVEATL